METKHLKLTASQFPFPCSLQTVVTSLYAGGEASEQTMPLEELLGYLKNISQFDINPVEAVLAQTEAIGDPAVPSQEHLAKMEWVNMAFSRWEEYFPLELPLRNEFRKLLPLATALAITDPEFMTPGEHHFHKLLDTMQEGSIGWQANPTGAVRGLARDLEAATNSACEWYQGVDIDLATIHAQLQIATEKDRGRSKRMAQRVVEAEQGKHKATRAKLRAANMINELLQDYQATSEVGDFLKGPWYESAQLLLLKHGAQSNEWTNMTTATNILLDSLQTSSHTDAEDEDGEARRQRLFETITRLPRELKQWLLSLQHDADGVSRAISAIETAHMQVLRQQRLQLEYISPIVIREALAPQESSEVQESIDKIEVGQWFLIAAAKKAPVRVQLALKIETDQQLLFTNHMGTKAMQQGYAYFVALLTGGQATPLDSGLSFSRSLAHAAEIRSPGDMTTLSGIIADRKAQDNAAREKVDNQEAEQLRKEYNDAVEAQRELDEAEQLLIDRADSQAEAELEPEAEPGSLDLDLDLGLKFEEEVIIDEPAVPGSDEELDEPRKATAEAPTGRVAEQETDPLQHERQLLEQREKELAAEQLSADQERQKGSSEGPKIEREIDYFDPNSTLEVGNPDDPSLFDLEIPMGTWMGFHDGDKPLMAKLAAHDKKRDTYIFVNREGIKMRDLNKLELVSLLDSKLIDMLETRSNFRDEITRIRKKRAE